MTDGSGIPRPVSLRLDGFDEEDPMSAFTSSGAVRRVAVVATAAVVLAGCGGAGRQVERALARRVLGSAKVTSYASVARKDLLRDLVTRPQRLTRARTVYRYMSAQEARVVRQRGIGAAAHFTSGGGPGRALTGRSAGARFGLGSQPTHRVAVQLPAGTQVKFNKTLGGEAGWGEIVVMETVPPRWVKSVVALR